MKTLPRQLKKNNTKKQSLIAFCAKQNNKNYYLRRQKNEINLKIK